MEEDDIERMMPDSEIYQRVKMSQHQALTKDLTNLITEYTTVQEDYTEKIKAKIRRQLPDNGINFDVETLMDQGNISALMQGIVMEEEQARGTIHFIQARHSEIIKLEKSVKELNNLFVDVSNLTEQQSEILDNIGYNMEFSKEKVGTATSDVRLAHEYTRKDRKKKMAMAMCFVIVGIIAIMSIANFFGF
ncbi:syntaxin-1A [Folsomia candida]|uniref:Syntaxin-1A n=1 Tax=Folsomia candida TaxID=158441 RepID=A0A226EWQ3_FOLCA|nr:syntaxin-1A [Folsomia candida]XP_035702596.1 syntaxin-1A [Folsomia candida]OXA61969.1 Syntaxin-1A [Folsomia candida]